MEWQWVSSKDPGLCPVLKLWVLGRLPHLQASNPQPFLTVKKLAMCLEAQAGCVGKGERGPPESGGKMGLGISIRMHPPMRVHWLAQSVGLRGSRAGRGLSPWSPGAGGTAVHRDGAVPPPLPGPQPRTRSASHVMHIYYLSSSKSSKE